MYPRFLSKDDPNFIKNKKAGDKIYYMDIVQETAYRSLFSLNKVNKVLNYYNNYLVNLINKGYIINYPQVFYFGYQIKKNKRKNLIEIIDNPIKVIKFDIKHLSINFINEVNLSPTSILKIIEIYNELFYQLFLQQKYEFSYLHLFYLKYNDKTQSLNGVRSLEVFNSKPSHLTFLVTNGNQQWLQTFTKKEFQINFHICEF